MSDESDGGIKLRPWIDILVPPIIGPLFRYIFQAEAKGVDVYNIQSTNSRPFMKREKWTFLTEAMEVICWYWQKMVSYCVEST